MFFNDGLGCLGDRRRWNTDASGLASRRYARMRTRHLEKRRRQNFLSRGADSH